MNSRKINPYENEISTVKPAVFDDPSLAWVAYAETRRTQGGMTGNLSDRPSTMNPEGYSLTGSDLPYDSWVEEETKHVKRRHDIILGKLSLSNISYPNPVHETTLFEVAYPIDTTSIHFEARYRTSADAALVTTEGLASCVTPADCPVINLVDTRNKSTLQMHTGYNGLSLGIVKEVLEQAPSLKPAEQVAFISPFARRGFEVFGVVLENLIENPITRDFVYSDGEVSYFNLGDATRQQLIDAGVQEHNIQMSTEDTLSNPTLFSHRNRRLKGADGRNGIVLGIKR